MQSNSNTRNILCFCLTLCFFSACSLVPSPIPPPPTQLWLIVSSYPTDLAVQTASAPQSALAGMQGANQKTVTFPDMVTKTALADPEPSEVDELSALLASFQAEEAADFSTASEKNKDDNQNDKGHDSHAAYVLEFKSKKAKGKRQIWVPETGEFKLTLTAGPRFELLDNDARDGEARVQMPASTLKTWVHLDESRNGGTLEVSDELYYVKDTLSKERKKHKRHADTRYNTWFKLGLRPVPVPGDWHSPDGQRFVLRFKAQQVQEFQLIWQKRRESAPFPPGVAEIGPEGGKVELPGVAQLEFHQIELKNGSITPALKEKTLFVIRQINSLISEDLLGVGLYKYVGTPVQIFPQNIQILGGAQLNIKLNSQLLKGISPALVRYLQIILSEKNKIIGLDRIVSENPNNHDEIVFSFNDWFELLNLNGIFVPLSSKYHIENKNSKNINNENDIEEHFRNQEAPTFVQTHSFVSL